MSEIDELIPQEDVQHRQVLADSDVRTARASDAPPCDEGLGRGVAVGRGGKTWQGERAKGCRAGVAKT